MNKIYMNNYSPKNTDLLEVTDSKTIKGLQLDVLIEFDRFCRENDIKYFLMFGTLIGAYRHKGFIPWDDDIDVGMLRSDYDKFLNTYNNNGDFYTLSNKTDKNYPYPFMKFCSKNTLCIEDFFTSYFNMGMNIDVFPLDYMSKDKVVAEKQVRLIKKRIKLNHLKTAVGSPRKLLNRNLLTDISLTMLKPAFSLISYSFINKRLNKIATLGNSNKSDFVVGINWGSRGHELLYDKDSFKKTTNVLFEGKQFYAPIGGDKVLRLLFGDYMEYPPLKDQVPHHDFKCYKITKK